MIDNNQNENIENLEFELNDEHIKKLEKYSETLNYYYRAIGKMNVQLQQMIKRTDNIEQDMNKLQEDICKELKIPRADKLLWDLNNKKISVVDQS